MSAPFVKKNSKVYEGCALITSVSMEKAYLKLTVKFVGKHFLIMKATESFVLLSALANISLFFIIRMQLPTVLSAVLCTQHVQVD